MAAMIVVVIMVVVIVATMMLMMCTKGYNIYLVKIELENNVGIEYRENIAGSRIQWRKEQDSWARTHPNTITHNNTNVH
jgi:hypothetical protein